MKKLTLLFSLLSLLLISSCRDIANTVLDVLPPFKISNSVTQELPFVSISTTSYSRTPEIPLNIDVDAKIKENNPKYGIENLKSVKLTGLSATYVSSQLGFKLDAIKNMRIYIKAPNLPEKLVATVYDNNSADQINFTTVDTELVDYFKSKDQSLIVEVQANFPSADRIRVRLDSNFEFKVQL